MEPEEADDVRFLLSYAPDTAGGLMTTEPIIVSADATVAEGLALIRRHELAPALGAAVCVTLPPYEPPTGRFLGMVHFQRMLRYPPHERLGTLLDHEPRARARPTRAPPRSSRILASYNLVSLPVVDENHRLVGVVTIDDVLDYLLPDDWRSSARRRRRRPSAGTHLDRSDPASRKEDAAWHALAAQRRPARRPQGPAHAASRRVRSRRSDRFGRFTEAFARAMGTPVVPDRPDGLRRRLADLEHRRARGAAVRLRSATRTSRC